MSTLAIAPTTNSTTAKLPEADDSKPSVREVQLVEELTEARAQIKELQAKVATLEAAAQKRKATTVAGPPSSSKKAKTTVTPVTPATSANQSKLVCKRLQQTIKNSLKGVKFYNGWDTTDRQINVNDVLSMEEFQAVFGNHGTLLQPTPENKPNSTVYIKGFDKDDLKAALGNVEFKGELWTKGSMPTGGRSFFFGGGGGFSKSCKIKGGCQVYIDHAEAKFSSNNGKLLLKCTFCNV